MTIKPAFLVLLLSAALSGCSKVSPETQKTTQIIIAGLNSEMATWRCRDAMADYPLRNPAGHPLRISGRDVGTHLNWGLIKRYVERDNLGNEFDVYKLTPAGKALYEENPDGSQGLSGRFCRADELQVKEIVDAQTARRNSNGITMIGVQYTIEAKNPHPEAAVMTGPELPFSPLFESDGKTPKAFTTTIELMNGKYLGNDPSLRYDRWINKP